MALCVQNHANVLPHEVSMELPGYACLLGNILETAGVALSQPDCSFEMVRNVFIFFFNLTAHLKCLPCSILFAKLFVVLTLVC